MAKNKKTNAMRMLDRAKIKYEVHSFEVPEEHLSGQEVAELIQANVKTVFKTLVLENTKHEHFVFVIPVSETLDMKKAAALVGEKKLQLMPLDNLKNVTGYIRGGLRTMQITIAVEDLITITKGKIGAVIHE
ncbi:TPA: Cys-tRNA(Pro) deacylase [Staphylococcus aureus]|uniref:YbaK/EbsC family protein n=1 Tax=Staphylococcus aureus TaxID=1280 RepID=UPI0001C0B9B1|nr:YbaK/EbsC family protein [Staphylococcus aureus]EFB50330.1 transcription regulator [Staphylococcus aureus subsp. aureus D139]EKK3187862.1 Cys-tRNA(Pro) deacylase [Staphylococcus aureus]EKZ8490054.1 Cys-tRNA(Pro) deacylase [Staphylococcus aureus]ELK6639625.1 Cys-tRNA(Pro) deacylase [Staphylococcus aureus]EOR37042.1 ybaK/ebsC protein [Staphylococcus aureus subsp. aureus 103564]